MGVSCRHEPLPYAIWRRLASFICVKLELGPSVLKLAADVEPGVAKASLTNLILPLKSGSRWGCLRLRGKLIDCERRNDEAGRR